MGTASTYSTPLDNSTLLPLLLLSLARQKHTPDTARTINSEYDYIIVGAGSAGSVVASRLSEKPCVSVLLLEAGPPPPLLTEVPVIGRSFWKTDIDWQYLTAPQKFSADALINRQVVWPGGKTLGGSSVINSMISVRGNRKNYDNWAKDGAKNWSYIDVLPYFKKLEDNRNPDFVANGYHGMGGPMTVEKPRYLAEIKGPVFEAGIRMGYQLVDSNAATQTGFTDFQATMRSGQRCSTAKAYLVPAENRRNLDIVPNAMVRKVLINNRRATGVLLDYRNTTLEVKARREVIISAGTINTAQLLMLSGIGPRNELERFNIPVVVELPVGHNLQDHVGCGVGFLLNPSIQPAGVKLTSDAYITQYIQNRSGPLASAEFVSVLTFLQEEIQPEMDFPNFFVAFGEGSSQAFPQFGVTPEVYSQLYAPYEGKPLYLCLATVLQPRSRGTVILRSKNPYDPPIIDTNYYEDPKDVQDMVDVTACKQWWLQIRTTRLIAPLTLPGIPSLKVCNHIGTSASLRRVGSTPFNTLMPGCEMLVDNEDAYLACFAKSFVFTLSHPVGTARMGDPMDTRTVVDPQLKVKIIDGLRVVDASVMPTITSANTNIPTIMIAEKASDMIKLSIKCHGDVKD